MDTGLGHFVEVPETKDIDGQKETIEKLQDEYEAHGAVFKVGEQIELKGSVLKVQSIKPKKLILKLLKKRANGS